MLGTSSFRRKIITVFGAFALAISTAGPASASETYLISPGDTLYSIANRFSLSVDELVRLNGLQNPNLIYAGQHLAIASTAAAQEGSTQAEQPAATDTYTVQAGDTLWGIASRFGISVAQLVEANRALIPDQNLIYPGQALTIPGGTGGAEGELNQADGQHDDQPAQPSQPVASGGDIATILQETAIAYGLDPALVQAIAWQESGWQQGVVSSSGALGVMQVMPATGGWVATELVGRNLDIAGNSSDNILAGVVYLEWLIRYTGDETRALAAYYQGPSSVSRDGFYADTYHYVESVQAIRSHIQQTGSPPRS